MRESATPDALARLAELPKYGEGVGLHRMLWLRDALGAGPWLADLDAVKVTGSNGKGSVCAMLAEIFRQLSVSCGLYTSPHLRDFRERIRVDGDMISPADLEASLEWTQGSVADYATAYPEDRVGAFEAFTILALHHFARRRPRVVVAEAGIGGRFDSTRVIPGSIAALTSLDLEHTEILGRTRELIAYDKVELCPEGGLLVVGAVEGDLLRRLEEYARLRRVKVVAADDHSNVLSKEYEQGHMTVDVEIAGRFLAGLEIALPGPHQVVNAIVAILLARAWADRNIPDLGEETFYTAVRGGLRQVRWPGRFQRISEDPDIFIDVGHSPAAIETVVRTAREMLNGCRILLVTGASHNKNVEQIVTGLLAMADGVICTRAWHMGSPVERIEEVVAAKRPDLQAMTAPTVEEAVAIARSHARDHGMTVLIAGGLFLSVEASEALHGRDPRNLKFF